jgi:small subunit ribosomal protein S17
MADEENNVEETEETPVAEPVSDTEVSDTADVAEAPVSDTEAAPAEEAVAEPEEAPAPEAEETPAAEEAPVEEAPAPAVSGPKPKRKRLPRSLRHKHSKPERERPATRKPITRIPKPESELGRRQERRGVVVSDKGDKTIIVKVEMTKAHRQYKKVVRRTHKFHAHDEQNSAGIGDVVRIIETRPLSKTKNWRLAEIVEKAK